MTIDDAVLALSAHLDGELPADARARTDFAVLPDERLGFDLSQVIRGRIEALPVRRGARRAPRWRVANWRRLLPVCTATAASLSLRLALGPA